MLPLGGMSGHPLVEELEEPLMCIHMREHWRTSGHEASRGSDADDGPRNS